MSEEMVSRLRELKEKIDSSGKLNKKELTELYELATMAIGKISFPAIVTGAAPKASKGGYYEIKLDTRIDGNLAHNMTDIFKQRVNVVIDPFDEQLKLRDKDNIPVEETEQEIFNEEEETEE